MPRAYCVRILFPHVNKIIENREYFRTAAVWKPNRLHSFQFQRFTSYFMLNRCAFIFIGNTNIRAHFCNTEDTQHALPTVRQRDIRQKIRCIGVFAFLFASTSRLHLAPSFCVSLLNIDSYSIRNAIGIKFPLPVYVFMEHWTASLPLITWMSVSERANEHITSIDADADAVVVLASYFSQDVACVHRKTKKSGTETTKQRTYR